MGGVGVSRRLGNGESELHVVEWSFVRGAVEGFNSTNQYKEGATVR